ncbi:hypothetical protein EYF80_006988 [Liparis tanakae]|uniref:Uncharacterized protein n=1 Tax=Liparis tanakae TaxID=230148 RepID=A0A4Z2IYA1_9TELE|nr:hypothetical protein EYF80_006988 [Liparis tanakae]
MVRGRRQEAGSRRQEAGGIAKETRPMRPLRQETQRKRPGHWEGGRAQARGWMQEAGARRQGAGPRSQDQLQAQPVSKNGGRQHIDARTSAGVAE